MTKKFEKIIITMLLVGLIFSFSPGLVLAVEEAVEDEAAEEVSQDENEALEKEMEVNEEALDEESDKADESKESSRKEDWELQYAFPHKDLNRDLEVDTVNGAAVYSYQFDIPLGRKGVQPQVMLSYNSQSKNEDNIVGYGWDLNLGAIERINKTGTDKLYEENYFQLTGPQSNQELVSLSGTAYGDYRAKVEGAFSKIKFFSDNYWQVTDKMGTVYTYGKETDSRVEYSEDVKTYKWMLTEIRDTNDNFIKYEYYVDNQQIYPKQITYTGHYNSSGVATDGPFTIEFEPLITGTPGVRSDVHRSYATGYNVLTKHRVEHINIKKDGQLMRKYDLGYIRGENNRRSLLNFIQETGYEAGVTKILPKTEFEYAQKEKGFDFIDDDDEIKDLSGTYGLTMAENYRDINGDTLPEGLGDILPGELKVPVHYLNDGDGWDGHTANEYWENNSCIYYPEGHPNHICHYPNKKYDINGDYYTDLVAAHVEYYSTLGDFELKGVAINNREDGWNDIDEWNLPSDFMFSRRGMSTAWRFIELNGDGLLDIARSEYQGHVYNEVYINNGIDGWELDSGWGVPVYFPESFGSHDPVFFHDFNNDGLTDIMIDRQGGGGPLININGGDGSYWHGTTMLPQELEYMDPADYGVRFWDINADGLMDIVKAYYYDTRFTYRVFINSGDLSGGWIFSESQEWNEALPLIMPDGFVFANGDPLTSSDRPQGTVLDINQDGIDDVYREIRGTKDAPRDLKVYLGRGADKPTDILVKVKNGFGGETEMTYKPSNQYREADGSISNPKLPINLSTLHTVTKSDGLGNSYTDTYHYAQGFYYVDSTDYKENTLAGFGVVTHTDPEGAKTVTYYHQGGSFDGSALGEFEDHVSKRSRPYRIERYDESGNLLTAAIQKWDKESLGNGRYFPKKTREVIINYEGGSDYEKQIYTYAYDSYGNITQFREWGEVDEFNPNTGWFDQELHGAYGYDDDDRWTETEYASNISKWIVGLPSQVDLYNDDERVVGQTKFYYDGLASESVNKGNLTQESVWLNYGGGQPIDSGRYLNTVRTYDNYGNVLTETNPRVKTTTYDYDSLNLYPIKVTNHKDQKYNYTYNYFNGELKTSTDPNGVIVEFTYDPVQRLKTKSISDPAGGVGMEQTDLYTYTDDVFPVKAGHTVYGGGTYTVGQYQYFDGFGRLIQSRSQMENDYAVRNISYTSRGQIYEETLPYSIAGSAYQALTFNHPRTRTSYDAMNRPKTVSFVKSGGTIYGSTNYDYSTPRQVSVTDMEGSTKNLRSDAFGRLVEVGEFISSSSCQDSICKTTYNYNVLDHFRRITDSQGNIKEIFTDTLGRQRSINDTHDSSDSTYSTWDFTYDDNSNLLTQTNPDGAVITYTYDDLDRISSEDYIAGGDSEIEYTYDTCTGAKAIGKMCQVDLAESGVKINYSYDFAGRLEEESKEITAQAETYITSFVTDLQGQVKTITYPDSSVASYGYNAAGFLETVSIDGSPIVTNLDYSPMGQISRIDYGNGVVTANDYDEDEMYRLKSKETLLGSNEWQDLTYTYDKVGNITKIIDGSSGTLAEGITDYEYDDLYRLTRVEITATPYAQYNYTRTYQYDSIGNRTYDSLLGNYDYEETGKVNPHAVTKIDGVAITYDNNGNVTANGEVSDDGTRTMTWNAKNQMQSVAYTKGTESSVSEFWYDQGGQRIKKIVDSTPADTSDPNEETWYFNQFFEFWSHGVENKTYKYVFAGNLRLATVEWVWFTDGDGDDYTIPEGDCDDTNPSIYPGAPDPCDGIDQACDGLGDEVDGDSDGVLVCSGDCNDADASIYPGAVELCDGKDNDCSAGVPTDELDSDSDGYMTCAGDCDDSDAAEKPGVTWYLDQDEDFYYGDQNQCQRGDGEASDWYADSHDLGADCDDTDALEYDGVIWYLDQDDDKYYGEIKVCERGTTGEPNDWYIESHDLGFDCDDVDVLKYPGAEERCNFEDDDCDGVIPLDEYDLDFDGYSTCGGDCDDSEASAHPGGSEMCGDEIDQDCSGGDLSCDLVDKLVFTRQRLNGNQYLNVYLNPVGVGGEINPLLASDLWIGNVGTNNEITHMTTGDVNGDRDEKLIFIRLKNGQEQYLTIYDVPTEVKGEINPLLFSDTLIGELETNSEITHLATGDIDGNGVDELILIRQRTNGNQYLNIYDIPTELDGEIDPLLASDLWIGNVGTNNEITHLATGDTDGDGVDELILIRHRLNGNQYLNIYNLPIEVGGEINPLVASDLWIGNVGTNNEITHLATGDIDSGGVDELIFIRQRLNGNQYLNIYNASTKVGGEINPIVASDFWIGNVGTNNEITHLAQVRKSIAVSGRTCGKIDDKASEGDRTILPTDPESTIPVIIPEPDEINIYFYHQDHLGGTSVVTDENGQLVQVTAYTPYGATRVDDKPQGDVFDARYGFTDQENDKDSHLYYYGARYYHAGYGRFYSIDPVLFDSEHVMSILVDPQQFNSYAYARNNPITFIDVNGEAIIPAVIYLVVQYGPALITTVMFASHVLPAAIDNMETTTGFVAGDQIDWIETSCGVDYYTGEQLSFSERLSKGGLAALPFISGSTLRMMKNSELGNILFDKAADMRLRLQVDQWGEKLVDSVGNTMRFVRDQLDRLHLIPENFEGSGILFTTDQWGEKLVDDLGRVMRVTRDQFGEVLEGEGEVDQTIRFFRDQYGEYLE